MGAKELYTSGEIGRILGIPARTARRYLQSGRIPAQQNPITGRWKVSHQTLLAFLAQHGMDAKRVTEPTRLSVVAVDDEEWITSFIRETLETSNLDLDVTVFTDSHEACIRLGQTTPDMVILDLRMPNIDGGQLLSVLRQNEITRSLPVLVISGYPDDIHKIQVDSNVEFLAKPFTCQQLVQAVCNMLDLPVTPDDETVPATNGTPG